MLKINGTTGEVVWRLNGKKSDFDMGKGTEFCFQHHARWLQEDEGDGVEVISLYDNSAHGTEHGEGREVHTAELSSGKILRLDSKGWKAELVQAYYPPKGHKLLSKSQGSTQVVEGSGNVVVNWGSEGAVTEYTADGEVVFHAYMDSGKLAVGVENYRAFRFNWTGLPSEEPAVVALEGEGGKTTVYVSWNGDTETKVWRFFEVVDGFGSREFLGEVERTSFETKLVVKGKVGKVAAEAVDKRGRVLRATRVAEVEPEVLPGASGKAKPGVSLSPVEGQRVLGDGADSATSRWEEYAILKLIRLNKDL